MGTLDWVVKAGKEGAMGSRNKPGLTCHSKQDGKRYLDKGD